MTKFTRLQVEALEDRCTPSGFSFESPPALAHLGAVAARFIPQEPFIPVEPFRVAPVFALNFGTPNPETLHALNGLVNAGTHIPGNPVSPVFFGLANDTPHPTF
jgi:hypothetical protein